MGNSALKSHLETSQKTGVFQLTGKGLQEVSKCSSVSITPRFVAVVLTYTLGPKYVCVYVLLRFEKMTSFR